MQVDKVRSRWGCNLHEGYLWVDIVFIYLFEYK